VSKGAWDPAEYRSPGTDGCCAPRGRWKCGWVGKSICNKSPTVKLLGGIGLTNKGVNVSPGEV
jgi:hypothetical protein